MDEYCTLAAESAAEFTEKRSRFIGRASPVSTQEEAERFLARVRSENRDAAHNVFAYRLKGNGAVRCSDDGEPQGTAGQPVLNVLIQSGAEDAAVVVTRYFGGVLLGAGGLVRAYSHTASLAVARARVVAMRACLIGEIFCSYSQYGRVAALVSSGGGLDQDAAFTDRVRLRFRIPCGGLPALRAQLADATGGTCDITVLKREFYRFD